MAVDMEMPGRSSYGGRQVYQPVRGTPILKLLLGDESGARSQLALPYSRRHALASSINYHCLSSGLGQKNGPSFALEGYLDVTSNVTSVASEGLLSLLLLGILCRYESIQVGEAAEVLVLSRQSSFKSFKASAKALTSCTEVSVLLHLFLYSLSASRVAGLCIDGKHKYFLSFMFEPI